MNPDHSIERLIATCERLGVVGSPSSTTELAVDVLGAAVNRKLIGELALFRFLQDAAPHYALGQVTEVKLRNVWHEDPTMRSLIRQRGRVDAVSERQDTHLAQVVVSAVFRRGGRQGYEPSILGTVPATGTEIHVVTDDILSEILRPYRDQIFYLGQVYGSKPKLPLWFKHFDTGPDGAGEAYHLGIFGKTGSGKSVLAKMVLLAYARYPKMALLVVDPQGEFARDLLDGKRGQGEFNLPLGTLVSGRGRPSFVLSVRNLVLDTWELFERVLYESTFFERLSVSKGANRQLAASVIAERLKKAKVKLANLWTREAFDKAWKLLGDDKVQRLFYLSAESRNRFAATFSDATPDEFFEDHWSPVALLFREESEDRPHARTVERALRWLLDMNAPQRPILVVDLSREQAKGLFWNDEVVPVPVEVEVAVPA